MFLFSRAKTLNLAGGAALAGVMFAGVPASAEEAMTHLGPVGPTEPILAKFGSQRLIAFYAAERGECSVTAVTWSETAIDAPARMRVSLRPGETFELDGAPRQAISLLCGPDAATLALMAPTELTETGAAD
jgi:hypothetical protein